MAKKTMTLTAADLVTFRQRNREGILTYNESPGTARVGKHSGSGAAYERRVRCDFSSQWESGITAESIKSVNIAVGLIASADNTETLEVLFTAWHGVSIGDTAEESGFFACGLGEYIGTEEIEPGTAKSAEYTLSGTAVKDLANLKVIGICPTSGAEIGDGTDAYAEISAVNLEIEYADSGAAPVVSGLLVTQSGSVGGLVAYTNDLTLSWNYAQDAGLSQSKIDVQMKTDGGSWQTITEEYATSAQSFKVTADQYPAPYAVSNLIYVRVRGYSTEGAVSGWADAAFAMIFPTAYDLSPGGGESVLADELIYLNWKARTEYNGVVLVRAAVPDTYGLEYSTDGGENWITLQSSFKPAETADGGFTWAPNIGTFPAGVVVWRVRPVVNGNTLESWVQESVVVRVQASTSSVSCDGKPHPTVSWSSASQIAYRVRFAYYDSGVISSEETSHTVPYIYKTGAYPVQVMTQAEDGTWSEWTPIEYVKITNTAPSGIVELYGESMARSTALRWMVDGPAEAFVVYRNDVPIYVGTARNYTDFGAFGECRYYIRAVSGGNYMQSNTLLLTANPTEDCMYDLSTEKWIPLRYSSAARNRSYTETARVVYKYYAGRKYPTAFSDGARERNLNVSYCFKTKEDADTVRESLGHLVMYKDTMGRRIVGIFERMSEAVTKRFEHQMTVTEVDYSEEVRYEA